MRTTLLAACAATLLSLPLAAHAADAPTPAAYAAPAKPAPVMASG
jgi:hypothetical protein